MLEEIQGEGMTDSNLTPEKYRAAFDLSEDGIIVLDRKGKIIDVNPMGLRLLGFASEEEFLSLGSPDGLFKSAEDLNLFREGIFKKGFVSGFETQLSGKDGCALDALISSRVVPRATGECDGYVISLRDISERRSADEEIERLNKRISTLDTISMTVSRSLNLNEVLESTIDKILEILEAASMRIYMLDDKGENLYLVADKGLSARFVAKSYFRRRKVGVGLLGKTVLTRETKVVDNFLRADDPYVDSMIEEGLQSSVYIPLGSKEKPVGVMCVSSHSEYKFSPNFVEFLTTIGHQIGIAIENANLYESLKKAYLELTEAQEQVIRTEKLASLGKLAATIAHEINNPLSVVLNYIKLMRKLKNRDSFTPERLEDISRYLTTMESETARCGEIVKNLLAFSRQSKVTMEDHSIEEIIDRTLTLISHDLEMKEMRLVRDIAPELPSVRCDFRQIQQALLNLMINASEAMTKGGVLTVSAEASEKEGFVKVAVSDNGCGIPKKDLRNIYEPFYTTKEEAKGVGLGLSVVYGIITRHGGHIEVVSEVHKGSTFEIHLPKAQ